MKTISRLLLIVCGILLIVVLFVPMWRIELDAPQYPEGLMMQIYPNKLGGNVDIINGLNHYIGMKTLHDKDFIEFKVLPGIIIFFSVFCLAVAVISQHKWLNWLFGIFVLFGIVAMADFWRWEYQYGHDLDPDAAIRIPGMAYQPPLIGFKQLLNFGAYSIPDVGGWIFIIVGCCLLGLVFFEGKAKKSILGSSKMASIILLIIGLGQLTACKGVPENIIQGKDACQFCKMTISDSRFGAAYYTVKGKTFKFDDIKCLQDFLKNATISTDPNDQIWLVDYMIPHALMKLDQSFLLKGGQLKTPMNGNIAVFSTETDRNKLATALSATPIERTTLLAQ